MRVRWSNAIPTKKREVVIEPSRDLLAWLLQETRKWGFKKGLTVRRELVLVIVEMGDFELLGFSTGVGVL